jgi:hypothetical protein
MPRLKESAGKVLEKVPGVEGIVLAFLLKGEIPTWACGVLLVCGIMILTIFQNEKEDKDD